jgi:hypothetical protein
MGFANSAPRFDNVNLVLQVLHTWTPRADAAIISDQVPWDSLYNGVDVRKYVINHYLGLVNYYRSLNLRLWVFIDPANGLDRTADASDLAALGKSIADADAQYIYRRFTFVMDSILKPDHLGLALETNLIRDIAPSAIYNGVKQSVNAAASDVRAYDKNVKLSVSIQADEAWGKRLNAPYQGIDQDLIDFPFVQELGISSYPYFVFDKPSDIPSNYYSKLVEGKNLPVFVSEGGWSSSSLTVGNKNIISNADIQKEYINYHAQLLDNVKAIAYFQLTFTDIDVQSLPSNGSPTIAYFSDLGMVDINLNPKPSLSSWDGLFNRKLKE